MSFHFSKELCLWFRQRLHLELATYHKLQNPSRHYSLSGGGRVTLSSISKKEISIWKSHLDPSWSLEPLIQSLLDLHTGGMFYLGHANPHGHITTNARNQLLKKTLREGTAGISISQNSMWFFNVHRLFSISPFFFTSYFFLFVKWRKVTLTSFQGSILLHTRALDTVRTET